MILHNASTFLNFFQLFLQISSRALYGTTPTAACSAFPSRKATNAGTFSTPNFSASAGDLSISALHTLIFPALFRANSVRTSSIMAHLPHHRAKNSRSTGSSDPLTSRRKFSSVISKIILLTCAFPSGVHHRGRSPNSASLSARTQNFGYRAHACSSRDYSKIIPVSIFSSFRTFSNHPPAFLSFTRTDGQ